MQIIELKSAILEKRSNFLYVKIKKNSLITRKVIQEQMSFTYLLMGNEELFTVLVDATELHTTTRDARDYMSEHVFENRVAIAILAKDLAISMLANLYIKLDSPITPTKFFKNQIHLEKAQQ